jgi:hypothetical protein
VTAIFVALIFGVAVAIAGASLACRIDHQGPPFAVGAIVMLATLVVVSTNVVAAWRFDAAFVATVAILPVLVGAVTIAARRRAATGRGVARSARVRIVIVAALMLAAPMLVLALPLDTDAQGFGFLALAIREGGKLGTLTPFRPGIAYLYSPGALIVFAAMSDWTRASIPAVMMGVSHASVALFVWLAWEFGEELGHAESNAPAWPWAMSLAALLNVGLWSALLDAHYPAIMAALFELAFVTTLFRFTRTGRWRDLASTAVTLSAVAMTHSDSALAAALALASYAAFSRFASDRPTGARWLACTLVVPAAAAAMALPWLVSIWPLMRAGIRSPFGPSLSHWRQLLLYQGIVWPVLSLVGAYLGLRKRRLWALVMIGWIGLAIESSMFGRLELSVPLVRDLTRFRYPYSMAWHAPIVPYLALATGGVVWLFGPALVRWRDQPKPSWVAAAALTVAILVSGAPTLRALSRHVLTIHGVFASSNDLKAMRWIRDNTPRESRVLNYPGDYEHLRDWEAHWAPSVAERDCIYFRMAPFFADTHALHPGEAVDDRALSDAYRTQRALLAFWRDPANPSNVELLRATGVNYVLVPEWIGDRSSLDSAWRWQPPAELSDVVSTINRAAYLPVVFRAGGAQVRGVPTAGPRAPRADQR